MRVKRPVRCPTCRGVVNINYRLEGTVIRGYLGRFHFGDRAAPYVTPCSQALVLVGEWPSRSS